MAGKSARERVRLVDALLARHGRTYSSELGIDLARNSPSVLFRWLCAALLFSARISTGIAIKATRALSEQGWTTPQKLRDAGWEARVRVLNRAGYARYDESTSRMLGDTAELLLQRYHGDLRKLREQAGGDPAEVRRRLQDFKGIGPTGADIFCREAQAVWPELYPAADRKALQAAAELGLAQDAAELASLVRPEELPRLLTALVRTALAEDYEEVRQAAIQSTEKDGKAGAR